MSFADAEWLSTAPRGNGTQPSHKYAPVATAAPIATARVKFGEAERA
jgi:hypothetical protein